MKRAAAEKLSQKTGGRNKLLTDRREETEKLQQAVGLTVLGTVVGNTTENLESVVFHHPELKYKRRVECRVGIFLKRKNPLLLAALHARPAAYGLDGRRSAIFVVAYYAAQQTVV